MFKRKKEVRTTERLGMHRRFTLIVTTVFMFQLFASSLPVLAANPDAHLKMGDPGKWVTTDSDDFNTTGSASPIDPSDAVSIYGGNIGTFKNDFSNGTGTTEAKVLDYAKALAQANWFADHYYMDLTQTKNYSPALDDSFEMNADLNTHFEEIRAMSTELVALDELQNVSSAFSFSDELPTADTIVGYSGFRDAMLSIVNDYCEAEVNRILSSVTWKDEWNVTEGEVKISDDMINALETYKKDLAAPANLYNKLLAEYQSCGSRYIKTTDKVRGYTRWPNYASAISDAADDKLKTVAAWISTTNEANTGSGESQQPVTGVNQVDTSKGVLPALANATLVDGNVVSSDGNELNLTELGYYVLAAGIVYDPFVDRAGNDAYMSVVTNFVKDTDKADELIRTLQVAVNYKKPLYLTESSVGSWVFKEQLGLIEIGEYRAARLDDLLESDSRVCKAYAVIKGGMRPSAVDSSTFDYVVGGTGSSSSTATSGSVNTSNNNSTGDVTTLDGAGVLTTAGTDNLTASSAQMSAPIMYSCGNGGWIIGTTDADQGKVSLPCSVGGLTTLIVNNAAKDCVDNQFIKEAATQMLFVNGLGDIVLCDGTIVLPAIANPAMYEYSKTSTYSAVDTSTEGESTDQVDDAISDGDAVITIDATEGYYPYNAALLNHYPSAAMKGDVVEVANSQDENKFIMSLQNSIFEVVRIKDSGKGQVDVTDIAAIPSVAFATDTFAVKDDASDKVNLFPLIKMKQSAWRSAGNMANNVLGWVSFGLINVGDNDTFTTRWLQSYTGALNREGVNYFPVKTPESDLIESYLGQVAPMVTSAVRYIGTRENTNVITSTGKFRVSAYITDAVGQAMLGTQYAEQLVKNYQLSYDELVNDQYGRFTKMIVSFTSDVINNIGHIDGVLALKDGYGSGFFNTIMGFVQEFYLVIVLGLMLLVATKFIKGSFSFLYVAMIGCLTFAAFNVYAVWMPTAVPAVYNMVTNDLTEEVAWNTLAVTSERYDETYLNSNNKDGHTGDDRPYTATITLYKMTQGEMESAAASLNIDKKIISSGQKVYLDRNAGIFIQGDQIKMSVDSLFANNTMRGLYKSQWDALSTTGVEQVEPVSFDTNDNPYIVKLTSPYVSLEAYYMPFCHFERAFLVNLNNFANIFRVERRYNQYKGDFIKDAFLFNAYTNSGVFIAPGDDEVLKYSILPGEIMGDSRATPDTIVALCHQCLDPMEDWLNLRSVFYDPNQVMRASVWGRAMVNAGYYNPDFSMTEEQELLVSDLISYINEQTKQFVIRNQEQLNYISDENAIKIVSLYATTCFTHRVSEFGYWLYPNYLNSSDIELLDVLYGAMTTQRDRSAASDGDVINTTVLYLGAIGAILLLIITIISVLFILTLNYLVPILYAMFGVILVYKLVNNEAGAGLVKGYVKVTLVSTGLYALYSAGLRLVRFGGYKWYGFLLCAVVSYLCLYFLFFVVMSVITNPLELGNDVLMRNMFGALDRLTGGRLGRITSNHLTINSRNAQGTGLAAYGGYMRRSAIDDRWNGRISRRGLGGLGGYGRFDDYDDLGTSGFRGQVAGFIGGHLGGNPRTHTEYRQSSRFRRMVNRATGRPNVDASGWDDNFRNFRRR